MSAPKANPVSRCLALVWALQGHSFAGLRLKQLAAATGESSSTTLRNLQALETEGMVERIADREGCWRLTPRLVQIAMAHQQELARLETRVTDFTQRYSRTP